MAKQNFDIITIGGATRDIIFFTDQGKVVDNKEDLTCQKLLGFELSAKINIKELHYSFGGGALNSSVSFSKLGFKVGTILRVGNDKESKTIIKELKRYKIGANLIQKDKKSATGFSFLIMSGKEKEYVAFLYRGANDNLRLKSLNLSPKAKGIYVSSLGGENWEDILYKVIAGKRYFPDTLFIWNPGNVQLKLGYQNLKKFLAAVDILILNKDEAIELVFSAGRKLDNSEQLLEEIKAYGPKTVVITEGVKGAWAYDGKKIYHQDACSVKVADTTGAGDAFGSTFAASLILYQNLEKALKLAIINSASVLTKIGAHNGLLNLKELLSKI